ncbi:MAG: hypothetical protein NTY69_00475 [Methylococcales bacterium]|nr:hypothetical protein [Methylococcales bacterium]
MHIWVGLEGVYQYFSASAVEQWNMLIGGINSPRETFQHSTDAITKHAQSQLIVNFCIDVGGYGILGLVVAWMIWTQACWLGYFIGLVVIGIADLAFTFCLLISGIIEINAGTVGGPLIWMLAIIITPFGLPPLIRKI